MALSKCDECKAMMSDQAPTCLNCGYPIAAAGRVDGAGSAAREPAVRGRMQEGMVADITIFDPETITDNATYVLGENGLPSTGIPYVLVNGVIIVKDSVVQDGLSPGQPIRYPVEDEGRWVPLERESYLENLLAPEEPELMDDLAPQR